ncbi:Integrase catalytic domain-containing protein [Citrus sinensis]|uniref:Integrase catalytic domain-containing protein n=1 Tax=Citrus sinensis TaxID=2711 RepID=A0ACB8M7A5_CITSI|nr:Integrase catalytic domain-containing protein [Citrus sinensis]
MGTTRFDLEKFNGENDFYLWSLKMRAILIQQGLDSALDGEEEKSKKEREEGSSSSGGDLRTMNNKAHSTIILHLSDEVLREVAKEKSASGLWAKLEELFLKKSLAKRLYMKMKLYTFSMKEGTSMRDHVDEFNKLILDLENVNVMLEDEDRALILLSSLPDSYEHFVDTLLYGRQTLTLKDVKNALESKDLKKRADGKDQITGDGLVAKAKTEKKIYKDKKNKNQKEKTDKMKKKRKCYFCQKEGHYIKDCFEKKKLEKLQKESSGKADIASVDEGESEDADVLIAADKKSSGEWILDSGCSFHMCPHKDFFVTFESIDGGKVLLGNNLACKVAGIGSVRIKMYDGSVKGLEQVRYVPELKRNLISLGMIDKLGCCIKAENGELQILKDGAIIMKGCRRNGLYVLKGSVELPGIIANVNSDKTRLWHMRLAHMSEKGLKELSKQGLLGTDQISALEFCEKCVFGKATRQKFNPVKQETKNTLDYIHSDLWGPSQVPSHGGARYFITFIDDFSRKVWVYVLKHKSEAFEKFKDWLTLIENQTERRVKRLRTDNGLEYCCNDFEQFCIKKGIARHKTVRHTPQQNGLAEKMNRTLVERVRCMLFNANLSKHFWAEAVTTAAYLVNRSPSVALHFKTPQEVWSGKPPDLSNLRVFGCLAYAHINQGKLEPKAVKGYFIGYPEGVKGYKIWCIDGKPSRTLISRDVVFDEEPMLHQKVETELTTPDTNEVKEHNFKVESSEEKKTTERISKPCQKIHITSQMNEYQLTRDREKRVIKPPKRYGIADMISYALAVAEEVIGEEPVSYKQAMGSKIREKWLDAMNEEIISLKKNRTWILVKKPQNKRLVGCKWIYKIKEGTVDGEPPRYKARLVAKGFTQKHGVDFNEVFSPVVKYSSIRILLAIAAYNDLELDQMDVKTAFLHVNLEEEILMDQPEGFIEEGTEDMVCLLKRSLYGLKQSPRQWYLRFDEFMISHGYCRSQYDSCVYFKILSSEDRIYLLLYVDDMLIACKRREEIERLKMELNTAFEMKDLGTATRILGMQIVRNRSKGTLFLTQAMYAKRVLSRFEMSGAKPVTVPMSAHFRLSKLQEPEEDHDLVHMKSVPYSSAVGSIMYSMVCTRPDVAHSVGVVSRFMGNPGREHWSAVKWLLRYMKGTANHGILYGGSESNSCQVSGFVDSDFAADLDKRRSITGYVFILNGGAVSWKASLQSVVALSTTEAEYIALTEAVKEAKWLSGLVSEFGLKQESVCIGCDSSSAIQLSKNPKYHERTKHIDVRLHFVRDEIANGIVNVIKVSTQTNPADILTKVVPAIKFRNSLNLVGVGSL